MRRLWCWLFHQPYRNRYLVPDTTVTVGDVHYCCGKCNESWFTGEREEIR